MPDRPARAALVCWGRPPCFERLRAGLLDQGLPHTAVRQAALRSGHDLTRLLRRLAALEGGLLICVPGNTSHLAVGAASLATAAKFSLAFQAAPADFHVFDLAPCRAARKIASQHFIAAAVALRHAMARTRSRRDTLARWRDRLDILRRRHSDADAALGALGPLVSGELDRAGAALARHYEQLQE